MATNFEYYKDKILEITENGIRIAMVKGELRSCAGLGCDDCDFFKNDDCIKSIFEWLYAEHIEQPKLTKRERAFCEAVQTGWIARDEDSALYFYQDEPKRRGVVWDSFEAS